MKKIGAQTIQSFSLDGETEKSLQIIKSRGYNISFILRDFINSFAKQLEEEDK